MEINIVEFKYALHQIRNGLTIINGNVDYLDATREFDENSCQAIHIGVSQILEIVNDLDRRKDE